MNKRYLKKDITWEMVENKEHDEILRVIRYKGAGF
jgi:hypothetical protein